MYYDVLRCTTMYYDVLRYDVLRYDVLRCTTMYYDVPTHPSTHLVMYPPTHPTHPSTHPASHTHTHPASHTHTHHTPHTLTLTHTHAHTHTLLFLFVVVDRRSDSHLLSVPNYTKLTSPWLCSCMCRRSGRTRLCLPSRSAVGGSILGDASDLLSLISACE